MKLPTKFFKKSNSWEFEVFVGSLAGLAARAGKVNDIKWVTEHRCFKSPSNWAEVLTSTLTF
jgi:hypothetical protein